MLHCDRCHKKFDGEIWADGSAGCYVVDSGYWHRYARPYETVICDECMWADPRYIADYGAPDPL
jgi:hypothetical protein